MNDLTEAEARRLTAKIKAKVADVLDLIARAFDGRADVALGYDSWDRYCHAEFPALHWTDTRSRAEAVTHLKERRMSNRAIGHALGMDEKTVRFDLRRSSYRQSPTAGNSAVGNSVLGLDNRVRPAQARCKPIPLKVTTKTAPIHYAREARALLADMDAQDYGPDDMTAEQLRATWEFREALATFADIIEREETAKESMP